MQIERSDGNDAKIDSSRVETLQPASNSTLESFVQPAKQFLVMVSIDAGMQIDVRNEQP
jgi:hypothetical protein